MASNEGDQLHSVLNEYRGVQFLKKYLDQSRHGVHCVNFWYLVKGLKLKEEKGTLTLDMMRISWKNYVHHDKFPYVDYSVKMKVTDHITQLLVASKAGLPVLLNSNIFSELQLHAERYMATVEKKLYLIMIITNIIS